MNFKCIQLTYRTFYSTLARLTMYEYNVVWTANYLNGISKICDQNEQPIHIHFRTYCMK